MKTCNWCFGRLAHYETRGVKQYYCATNPECPAFAMVQIPAEMLPWGKEQLKKKLAEIEMMPTVKENLTVQNPPKVRRSKKDVLKDEEIRTAKIWDKLRKLAKEHNEKQEPYKKRYEGEVLMKKDVGKGEEIKDSPDAIANRLRFENWRQLEELKSQFI